MKGFTGIYRVKGLGSKLPEGGLYRGFYKGLL